MKKVFRTFLLFAMLLLPQIASADYIVSVYETGTTNAHSFTFEQTKMVDVLTAEIDMTQVPWFTNVNDLTKYSYWVGNGNWDGRSENCVLSNPLWDASSYMTKCKDATKLYMSINVGTRYKSQMNYYPHHASCGPDPVIVSSVDFLDLAGEKCFHLRADYLDKFTVTSYIWEYSLNGTTWNSLATTTDNMLVVYTKDFPSSNVYYRVKAVVDGTEYTSGNTAYVQVLVNCDGESTPQLVYEQTFGKTGKGFSGYEEWKFTYREAAQGISSDYTFVDFPYSLNDGNAAIIADPYWCGAGEGSGGEHPSVIDGLGHPRDGRRLTCEDKASSDCAAWFRGYTTTGYLLRDHTDLEQTMNPDSLGLCLFINYSENGSRVAYEHKLSDAEKAMLVPGSYVRLIAFAASPAKIGDGAGESVTMTLRLLTSTDGTTYNENQPVCTITKEIFHNQDWDEIVSPLSKIDATAAHYKLQLISSGQSGLGNDVLLDDIRIEVCPPNFNIYYEDPAGSGRTDIREATMTNENSTFDVRVTELDETSALGTDPCLYLFKYDANASGSKFPVCVGKFTKLATGGYKLDLSNTYTSLTGTSTNPLKLFSTVPETLTFVAVAISSSDCTSPTALLQSIEQGGTDPSSAGVTNAYVSNQTITLSTVCQDPPTLTLSGNSTEVCAAGTIDYPTATISFTSFCTNVSYSITQTVGTSTESSTITSGDLTVTPGTATTQVIDLANFATDLKWASGGTYTLTATITEKYTGSDGEKTVCSQSSQVVTRTILPQVNITLQPTPTATCGTTGTAELKAEMSGVTEFEWQYSTDGVNWSKAPEPDASGTSTGLAISTTYGINSTIPDGTQFRVSASYVGTNVTCGPVYSNAVTFTRLSEPVITTDLPTSVSRCKGAVDGPTLAPELTSGTYNEIEWFYRTSSSATSWTSLGKGANYVIPASHANGYQYKFVAKNIYSGDNSIYCSKESENICTLNEYDVPGAVTLDASIYMCAGADNTTITANVSQPYTAVQWQRLLGTEWVAALGTNDQTTYTVPSTATDGTKYRIVVTNGLEACNATSSETTLHVIDYPVLAALDNVDACRGVETTLQGRITNEDKNHKYSYLWEVSDDNATWSPATGTNTALSYSFTPGAGETSGTVHYYRLTVTDITGGVSCATTTSNSATVTVVDCSELALTQVISDPVCPGSDFTITWTITKNSTTDTPGKIEISSDGGNNNVAYPMDMTYESNSVAKTGTSTVTVTASVGSNPKLTVENLTPGETVTLTLTYRNANSTTGNRTIKQNLRTWISLIDADTYATYDAAQGGTKATDLCTLMATTPTPTIVTDGYKECAVAGSKQLSDLVTSDKTDLTWINAQTGAEVNPPAFNTATAGRTIYRVKNQMADMCESDTTSVPVEIAANPSITADLNGNYYMCAEETGSVMTVTASSVTRYQWQTRASSAVTDWTDIANSNSATYTAPSNTADGTQFRVLLYNESTADLSCGAVTSAVATVNVASKPNISKDLETSYEMCEGEQGPLLEVTATISSGNGLTYQWERQLPSESTFSDISGATSATYQVLSSTVDGTKFRLALSNRNGAGVQCSEYYSTEATISVAAKPVISVDLPSSNYMCQDVQSLTLTITATNVANYEWQTRASSSASWTTISGATGSSYAVPAETVNGTQFRVLLSNNKKDGTACSVVASAVASVTVAADPSVTVDLDENYYMCEGEDGPVLRATATNVQDRQWETRSSSSADWTEITGETAMTYTVPNDTKDGTQFRLRLANKSGGTNPAVCNYVYTQVATIHVAPKPAISVGLNSSYFMCQNEESITLSVTATNVATNGYKWQMQSPNSTSWIDLGGNTSASRTVPAGTANGTKYKIIVNNVDGQLRECKSTAESVTTISVAEVPSITKDLDADHYMCEGQDGPTLEVTASASTGSALVYQWESRASSSGSWTPVSNANEASYDVPSTTTDGTQFRLAIANSWSSTATGEAEIICEYAYSQIATIHVAAKPVITTDLGASYDMCIGVASLKLNVVATNATNYQWQTRANGSATWTDIDGATESSYDVPADTQNNAQFRVLVYNTNGNNERCNAVESATAIITVNETSALSADNYDECSTPGTKALSDLVTSTGYGTLKWYDADGNQIRNASFNTAVAGETTYYVTDTNASTGCESERTAVTVTITANTDAPTVEDYNECPVEGTKALSDLVTSEYSTLVWYDKDMQELTSPTFDTSVTGNTVYNVSATTGQLCASATASVTVNIKDVATASDISAPANAFCAGETATLTATTTIDDRDIVFTWYADADLTETLGTGAELRITVPDADATYYVTVQGLNTCENLPGDGAEAKVTVNIPIVSAALTPESERIGLGQEVTKTLELDPSGTDYSAVWTANDNEINPDGYFPAKPYNDVQYKVVITDECGRVIETSASVSVVWPTIITPHHVDGINDDFLGGMGEDIHLEIYDRYGNRIFSGNDGWDQASAAENLPGVYFFTAQLPDGSVKKGTIEIYK